MRILAVLLLFLSACAVSEQSVAERTYLREEPNLPQIEVVGPLIEGRWQGYALQQRLDLPAPELYVILKSERPMRVSQAWHAGQPRAFATLSRDPGNCTWSEIPTTPGCLMREHLAVALLPEDITKAQIQDFSVSFSSPRGVREVMVPAAYTRGFLAGMERLQASPNTR